MKYLFFIFVYFFSVHLLSLWAVGSSSPKGVTIPCPASDKNNSPLSKIVSSFDTIKSALSHSPRPDTLNNRQIKDIVNLDHPPSLEASRNREMAFGAMSFLTKLARAEYPVEPEDKEKLRENLMCVAKKKYAAVGSGNLSIGYDEGKENIKAWQGRKTIFEGRCDMDPRDDIHNFEALSQVFRVTSEVEKIFDIYFPTTEEMNDEKKVENEGKEGNHDSIIFDLVTTLPSTKETPQSRNEFIPNKKTGRHLKLMNKKIQKLNHIECACCNNENPFSQ